MQKYPYHQRRWN